jgi:hypothetical protein
LQGFEFSAELRDAVAHAHFLELNVGVSTLAAPAAAAAVVVFSGFTKSRHVVAQPRELDFEARLAGLGALFKDVQNDRGAVNDGHAEPLFKVGELSGRQVSVHDDEVHFGRERGGELVRGIGVEGIVVGLCLGWGLDMSGDLGDSARANESSRHAACPSDDDVVDDTNAGGIAEPFQLTGSVRRGLGSGEKRKGSAARQTAMQGFGNTDSTCHSGRLGGR